MAPRKLTLATIRRVASALPDLEEGTSYGTPAWKHRGRLLARLRQDGQSIVLAVGDETRDHLLRADPETFFVTDHYRGYPMVLARLDRLSAPDLGKLLARATERVGAIRRKRSTYFRELRVAESLGIVGTVGLCPCRRGTARSPLGLMSRR